MESVNKSKKYGMVSVIDGILQSPPVSRCVDILLQYGTSPGKFSKKGSGINISLNGFKFQLPPKAPSNNDVPFSKSLSFGQSFGAK